MEFQGKGIILVSALVVGLFIIFILIFVSNFSISTFAPLIDDQTTYSSSGYLLLAYQGNGVLNPKGDAVTTTDVSVFNRTWLDFDGTNDVLTLSVAQSKSTINFWFKNETTAWSSVIKSGSNIYVNSTLNNDWAFYPYYISGDNIYIGKSDASTFLNVSIDEFRIYETALNSTEVTTLYNEGR